MKMLIGMMNDEGRAETKEISSPLLLKVLAEFTFVAQGANVSMEDGPIFKTLCATIPSEVPADEYEEACEQLGLLHGMILESL